MLRAKIAQGDASDVVSEVEGAAEPELAAVGALATYELGETEEAVKVVEKLAEEAGDNATVQVLGGIVLQREGRSEDALNLLGKHEGSRRFFFFFALMENFLRLRLLG